jgi:hypothetical protein
MENVTYNTGSMRLKGLKPFLAAIRAQFSDPVDWVQAIFEWDGEYWRLIRLANVRVDLPWEPSGGKQLSTGKQIIDTLDYVRPNEERVRFQARVRLQRRSTRSNKWLIYPATVASYGEPLYQNRSWAALNDDESNRILLAHIREQVSDKVFLQWVQESGCNRQAA